MPPSHRKALLISSAVGLVLASTSGAGAHLHRIDGVRPVGAAAVTGPDQAATARDLLAIGDVPGALAVFRSAMNAAPSSTAPLLGIAACYDALGRPDVARSFIEAALALAPDASDVLAAAQQGDGDGSSNAAPIAGSGVAVVTPPHARIVQLREGEQLLILAPSGQTAAVATRSATMTAGAMSAALAGNLGDDASAEILPVVWTPADDNTLAASDAAEQRLSAAASLIEPAAASVRKRDLLPPTPLPLAIVARVLSIEALPDAPPREPVATLQLSRPVSSFAVQNAGPRQAAARAMPTQVGQTSALRRADALLRRRAPGHIALPLQLASGPLPRSARVEFASGDALLDAFAGRMAARTGAAVPGAAPPPTFRDALASLTELAARECPA